MHKINSLRVPIVQQLQRNFSSSQVLATVIVKRVYKPPLVKLPGRSPLETPQHLVDKSVVGSDDDKWLLYEVEEKSQLHHDVKLILVRNVDDYGVKGQVVSVPFHLAHPKLLLPGFAVYHTDENVEKHKDIILPEDSIINSSATARDFIAFFSKRVFDICLSSSTPWTIEKWHIKASLRKHKVWVKEDQIEIPGEKFGSIKGPDLSLENKEFVAILNINNLEKLKIRCRIHHLDLDDQIPKVDRWYLRAAEPVWEEERGALLDMNRAPPNMAQRKDKSFADEVCANKMSFPLCCTSYSPSGGEV